MENRLGNEHVDSLGTTANDLVAIGRLLDSPRLAHIWFILFIEGSVKREECESNPFTWDGLTVKVIQEEADADIPESTLYEDIEELVDINAIREKSATQPRGYEAKFFQAEAGSVDRVSGRGIVGPELIGSVGKAQLDDSVDQFLTDYTPNDLNNVVEMLAADMRGQLERSVAEMIPEADNADVEAILPAIRDVFSDIDRHPLIHKEDSSKFLPDS